MTILRPLRRKNRKPDKEYLEFIRSLPCWVCRIWGDPQTSRTEVAHVGERGLGTKCPDNETVPLCVAHHRTGKESYHVLGKGFWRRHGLNKRVVLAKLQFKYAALHPAGNDGSSSPSKTKGRVAKV